MATGHLHKFGSALACPVALFASATTLISMPAAAQVATADAEAQVVLVRRLSFFKVDDLLFGGIIPGPTAGVVRVTPAGVRTATGGVILSGNGHQPARFAGQGVFNQNVRIRLGANTIQLTGPGAPMTVSQFEIGSTPTNQPLTTTFRTFRLGNAAGIFNFPIGARVAINANQRPGIYRGTFTVQLEYQ